MSSPTYHIITFGCQMNEHDSERMAGLLEGQGYGPANAPESADMIILNTCSIRQKAEQKFYSELGRLQALKDANPGLTVVVAGCIAQQEGGKLLARAPQVDMVIGPSDIARFPALVPSPGGRPRRTAETAGDPEYHLKTVRTRRNDRLKAWVSIMYGCDNFCTYCVVPTLRGRERSRPAADILAEVRGLAEKEFKEVTLLGQNVNSYGKGEGTGFPELLTLVNGVDGIERIRFVTSHPKDLSPDLAHAIRDLNKVCEAVHLPVQSGSDRILRAMNRRYTSGEYREKVSLLRGAVDGIALTTDIIVGFPGETEEDFTLTFELLREVRYDGIFAFKYSKRPNTAALTLDGQVPEEVKDRRLAAILDLQREITLEKNREAIGRVEEVLVEGRSKKGGLMTGRTRGNKAVNFPATEELIGSLVKVRLRSAGMNSLSGELA